MTTPPLPSDDPTVVSDLVHLMIRDQRIRTEVTRASHMWFFLTYLAEIGAERDTAQQAKTRWALEFYSGAERTSAAA